MCQPAMFSHVLATDAKLDPMKSSVANIDLLPTTSLRVSCGLSTKNWSFTNGICELTQITECLAAKPRECIAEKPTTAQ